ncbi:MAG TPA: serine protease [Nitrososphaerales archaeon]|nr:serine protease [Nitrososphaerales archaeon]
MFRKTAERILKSTALILARHSDGEEYAGTAFATSKQGYLLTCSHVIGDANNGLVGLMRVSAPYDTQEFDVVARNPVKDLAVLKLRRVPEYFLEYPDLKVDMNLDDFGLGKSVATCGFPMPKILKRSWVTAGVISSITHPKEGGPYEFQINVSVLPGNSGGAVFTQEGYIIGMVKQTVSLDGQFLPYTTALHIADIAATIRTLGLDFGWTLVSDAGPTSTEEASG